MTHLAEGFQEQLVTEIKQLKKYFVLMQLFKSLLATQWFGECCNLYMRIPSETGVDEDEQRRVLDLFMEVLAAIKHEIESRSLQELSDHGENGFQPMVDAAKALADQLGDN